MVSSMLNSSDSPWTVGLGGVCVCACACGGGGGVGWVSFSCLN